MLNKKAKRVKGSVLYTVIAVMMIMTVLVAAALTLASSANKRAYNNYADNQTQYTARSVIDSVWEAISSNSEIAGNISKLNKNESMDITIGSIDKSMGEIVGNKVIVSCLGVGTEYGYDSPDKFFKLSTTVKMLGQENTVAAYYLSQEDKNFDFNYALVSLDANALDNAKIYNGVSVAIDNNGASGMSNNTHLNSPIEVNGDYDANLDGDINIHENQGMYINGNFTMINGGEIKSLLNDSVSQDKRSYRSMPYMYIAKQLIFNNGSAQNIGSADNPMLLMADSLQKNLSEICSIYGDVYLTGSESTNIWGNGITVFPFNNNILKKKNVNGQYYTGGNIYSLGEINYKLVNVNNIDLANNIIVDSLKISPQNQSPNINAAGSVVANNIELKNEGGAVNSLNCGGLFVDPEDTAKFVIDDPTNKTINSVGYNPDNPWRKTGKSDMHNNTNGTIEAVKDKMYPLNNRVEFASIDFSDALNNNIAPPLIDSDDKKYEDIKKEVVFNNGSVEIDLEKPQNLINDEVTISLGLSGTWVEYKFPSDGEIANGAESKIHISLNNQTLTPTDDGKVKLNIEIKPKYDMWNYNDWNTAEYYNNWTANYIANNKTDIENTAIINWLNTYYPENANQAIINMKQQCYMEYYSKAWGGGHFPPPSITSKWTKDPPYGNFDQNAWLDWYWESSGDLTDDQKTEKINGALLEEGRRLWEDPDNTYISQEDKDKLIKDEEDKACKDEWQRLCENQPKEIKIKSITVNYNAQIKRSYNELTRNAKTYLEWIKFANDIAFNNKGGVIYIDDIDKSVKLEKKDGVMYIYQADLKSKEGEEDKITPGEYTVVGTYDYDTQYADFLRKVVETATFPESMKNDNVLKTKGGFIDNIFLQRDSETGKPNIVIKAEKEILEAFSHIDETEAAIYDNSNPCPDIIEESCTITGNITNRTITFKPETDDIYVKVGGLSIQNTKFIVEDGNGGKVHFLIPDGKEFSIDQSSAVLNKYFSESNDITQNPTKENEFYDSSNPDSLEYIADQERIPGIYFYSNGTGKISCSNQGSISAYILMPDGEMSFGGSGGSNTYDYDGRIVNDIPGGVLIGAAVCRKVDLSNMCLFAYVNPNPIGNANNKKVNYKMSCLYYQAY